VTQDAAVEPTFAVGRALGTSCAILFRNLAPFGVLALVLGLLPVLIDWVGGGAEFTASLSGSGEHGLHRFAVEPALAYRSVHCRRGFRSGAAW